MKILAALSGGVDSAVAAALLAHAGHEVIGIHLQFWTDDFRPGIEAKLPENKCCSLAGVLAARTVCEQLGLPFYVLNFREQFRKNVVEDFLAAYAAGVTPNPCVTCNRQIKFGYLLQKMRELGAEAVATGHYASVAKVDATYELHRPADAAKDQTYFLHHLGQDKLKHILFPLGKLLKNEVRELAEKYGLPHTSGQKESTGVCFFPEAGPQAFLARRLPADLFAPGPIRTHDGKIIGTHAGLPRYTIGQRRGVELGGLTEPYFVTGFDRANNTLLVGPESELATTTLHATALHFVAGTPPAAEFTAEVTIRYRGTPTPATVRVQDNHATVIFDKPVRAVTPGQAVVFYRGTQVLGGGTIVAA